MRISTVALSIFCIASTLTAGIITSPGSISDSLTYTGTNGTASVSEMFSVVSPADILVSPEWGPYSSFFDGLPRCIDAQNHLCDSGRHAYVQIFDSLHNQLYIAYEDEDYYFCNAVDCQVDYSPWPTYYFSLIHLDPGTYSATLNIRLNTDIPSTPGTDTLSLALSPLNGALFTTIPEPMNLLLSVSGIFAFFGLRLRRNRVS